MKYAELVADWLVDLGYTHCFTVAGGNSMHLLDAVRKRMTCVPVVHEVAAGIAVEYFNEAGRGADAPRAFALVTAGPGLTNIVTAMAGAFLESRELLVLGGQVKSSDLATGGLRQRGIQEIDGRAIAAPVCVATERIERPIGRERFAALVEAGRTGRPGPVFIELCLDAQGAPVMPEELAGGDLPGIPVAMPALSGEDAAAQIAALMDGAERPVWLLGGGVSREAAAAALPRLRALGIPLMTTWNGTDRLGADEPLYFGRPNTWGQRAPNLLLAQADVVVALGTRLGLQQTGFNWQEFAPCGKVAQVDLDATELEKGHPVLELGLQADADETLAALAARDFATFDPWVAFCREVTDTLPLDDPANETAPGYLSPYGFVAALAERCAPGDVIIPCSSGGAFTTMMQGFAQREGQTVITDKGLASMGYGLSGAIGAALAQPGARTVLVEGDGGFAQNLQELATARVNDLNLKIFIFANNGYASIRMTQRNYFGGEYLGCDVESGLGFPDWANLFGAFRIPVLELGAGWDEDEAFRALFDGEGPAGFVVPIDPEQSYFPKIASRVAEGGGMESNPLHQMSPDLPADVAERVGPYLQRAVQAQGAPT